ncbi:MAG: hypothetical protein CMH83_13220 [Nocardioides sp.]|nr:hypothetical protein [Nocardioides sp.]
MTSCATLARMRTTSSRPRRLATASATVLASLVLAACSGGDSSGGGSSSDEEPPTPEEVLAYAKEALDSTSGVRLSLATEDEVDSDAFLKAARGVIPADPPAFEGTADGSIAGFTANDIEVRSVDGDFYVNVFGSWQEFDPAELCAPDPGGLLDPDTGVSQVLTSATDLEAGEAQRGGADNSEVVTPYTGTVPGTAITNVLPCAPGDTFDATFTVNSDDGRLVSAELTGEFVNGADPLTYTIDVEEYDVEQEIAAP